MHILLNISRIKDNHSMKFGQLIEHPKRNIYKYIYLYKNIFFFENYEENEAGKLVPDHFLFFKKALYLVKATGLQLDFTIFR